LAEYGLEKYFTHALGHWIGIAVHEYPIISSKNEEKITPGMVFTIEPGVYIPWKFWVRWENIKIIE
jgi:Xaa-Pro aminopeptidase